MYSTSIELNNYVYIIAERIWSWKNLMSNISVNIDHGILARV